MAKPLVPSAPSGNRFTRWLLKHRVDQVRGPEASEGKSEQHPWWQVVCLTGVDYFSTLGYIPAIAAANAGALSPIATGLIVLLTLFGMLPMYRVVAAESPQGQGSVSMLERLLSFWKGKIFVLCLLGFVATAWIVTITLSAADATAHIVENPFWPEGLRDYEVAITLVLLAVLGAVFLRGFKEAIGIAVVVVAAFLLTNLVVVLVCLYAIVADPSNLARWQEALFTSYGSPLAMLGQSLLIFPLLALGLSGFETGVSMMPLVQGAPDDDPSHPRARIRNTQKMLAVAAIFMSFHLITTTFVPAVLIPAEEFALGGAAKDRAMAYLAHEYLGDGFGTIYDLSTISILWFAGASAMAGLLNIVPRYLPRYGMAPNWARATRPLVLVYTVIAFVVTIIFKANVEAQGGAYATGVLVLITSAAFAVTLSAHRQGSKRGTVAFAIITLLFVYTTIVNIIERPEGIRIAGLFIAAIILTSLVSRVWRSTELRVERIEIDETASGFITQESRGEIRLIAKRRNTGSAREYFLKEKEVREDHHIPPTDSILFLEIRVSDASEFAGIIRVKGEEVDSYRVLRAESAAVPNAIAAILLHLRDETGKIPHAYFGWAEGNPIQYLLRFILFGEGDIAVVTREVLRKAEKKPERRPAIHVGG